MSVTKPCAREERRSRVGLRDHGDAGDPLDRGRDLDGDTPGGDVADGDPANGLPARLVGGAEATAAGSAITSAALAAPRRRHPHPAQPWG